MKVAALMMAALGIGLFVALWRKGEGALEQALSSAGTNGVKLVPIILLAVFMMGALEVLLPKDLVHRWLSDAAGFRGIAIAWLAGILTPGGSLLGMPIVAGLYKAGVSASVLVTYLVSMATLSVIRLPIEIGLIGPRLTMLRVASCLILPPIAGLMVRATRGLWAA